MPDVAFVMSPRQDYPLRELVATLEYELGLQGVPAALHLDGFPEHRPDRVYVLMGPRDYVHLEGVSALPETHVLKRTVFVGNEDPDVIGDDEGVLELLRRAGAVFDLDQRAVLAMRRAGIRARVLKPGYSAPLDRFDPQASRPVDVMFYGRPSPRRKRELARWTDVLARHNCVLRLADDDPHAGDASSSDSAGRRALLARTKVLVCLHRDDKPYFEWSRAIDAIHAGAVVVSEHSSGLAPLEPGKHLLVGSPDSLPFLVDALLRDDDQLARLRVQAHERLSAWLPAALHVAVLRAAIVELVGEPVPPGTYMGQPARRDGRDRARSREPDGAEAGTDRAIRRALDDVRRDLAAVRRHVARVEETMQTASGAPPIRVAHESPAWAARRGAKVSVLVAFNEGGDPLVRTLGSVAESSLRDLEIVVVARGANRADEQSASQWLDRRPHLASRLVVQHVDHGVGAARNVASDFARSPYWLIVDPGQELLPRCLAVLADALDTAPDVAFAYPMQQAIAPGADDQDLVNYVGWDRERLREEDYIHAPALIRADRVRQVGRFGEGPSFEGKVDHDLWCRLADQGWKGLGVPQILARRREDPSGRV